MFCLVYVLGVALFSFIYDYTCIYCVRSSRRTLRMTCITLPYSAIKHIEAGYISCIEQLGEGAFGRVFLGQCYNIPKEGEHVMVAIKMLKDDVTETRIHI